MEAIAQRVGYILISLLIALNFGLLMRGIIYKIAARVGRRRGIPVYQPYIDLVKLLSLRTHTTHGFMFYLGPVFRLTGGIGVLVFVPLVYGSEMFGGVSFAGDMILVLYFIFFGSLGMAMGGGEGGNPNAAIGITRGLSQMTASEVPLTLSIVAVAVQYHTLSITDIVAAQQGSIFNWTVFTNPLAVVAGMFALLGSFMNSPFDIVQAPNEIPIGPPTEHHSSYLATLQTNRSIFPVAKLILFVNLFFGGASSMVVVLFKAFLLYLWPAFVGVVFPRYRTEQSISWFLKVPTVVGIAAIIFFV